MEIFDKTKNRNTKQNIFHFLPIFYAAFLATYLASYYCCLSNAKCAF